MKQDRVLVVIGLLIVMSISTIGCSDKSSSAKSASDRSAGSSGIFEKGKTYDAWITNDFGKQKFTVLEIGPDPWLKVKLVAPNLEGWLNCNYILMTELGAETPAAASQAAVPETPKAASKVASSVIKTGKGDITLESYGKIVPADALKEVGAACLQYMVKQGDSWFTCRLVNGEKRIFEYRTVEAHFSVYEVSDADRLNGYVWRGSCFFDFAAAREYASEKWGEWSTPSMIWETRHWSLNANEKDGVWNVSMENSDFLPTSKWSIPQDSK